MKLRSHLFSAAPVLTILAALPLVALTSCDGTGHHAAVTQATAATCEDSHTPGCFFDKRTVQAESGAFSYARHNGVFLTGSLDLPQLQAMKDLGAVAVIDIRQSTEDRSVLENAAKSLGLIYQNTPLFVPGTKEIRLEGVQEITAFHKTYKSTPHIVACSSGNRSSAWFGAHQFLDHNLSGEAAIAAAREAFLRDDMAENLTRFFENQPQTAP